jgi:fructan beta-fructosidase
MSDPQLPALYHEPFRPQYHYSPPRWWMNDPNGLVYDQGEYHLFYQYHPDDVVWGPMHWGHAVSRDLVHWETLPIALYPDDLGTIFSGTVVLDTDNTSGLVPGGGLVALYSYNTQTQGAAYSTDQGRTWIKYDRNPILPALEQDFRDPKVFWHAPTARWVMAISAGTSIMFLTSPDLLTWTVVSRFAHTYSGGVWEVPDLFTLEADGVIKWILIISVNATAPAGGSGTFYFVGDFDGATFTPDDPEQVLWLDYGPDNYAGTTWNNVPDGRRLFMGWMNNWLYANVIPTSIWRSAMTLPRELTLRFTPQGYRLIQTPIDALKSLRWRIGAWRGIRLEGQEDLEVGGQQIELIADFDIGTATTVGVEVLANATDAMRIVYDVAAQRLLIHRPDAQIANFPIDYSAPLLLNDGHLRLHLFIDQSSVEVFANDGILSMTSQVFPAADAQAIRFVASGGTATLTRLEWFEVKGIWK